jgi:hypothetical protein
VALQLKLLVSSTSTFEPVQAVYVPFAITFNVLVVAADARLGVKENIPKTITKTKKPERYFFIKNSTK